MVCHLLTVNDLISDCPNSEDEPLCQAVIKKLVTKNLCLPHSLPCLQFYSQYFPIEKLCVYEVDIEQQMAYCRNGFHMKECTNLFSSQTLKCASYCIPLHYICVWHCPNGEDEQHCAIKITHLCQVNPSKPTIACTCLQEFTQWYMHPCCNSTV